MSLIKTTLQVCSQTNNLKAGTDIMTEPHLHVAVGPKLTYRQNKHIYIKTHPSISNIHIRRVLVQDKAYIE